MGLTRMRLSEREKRDKGKEMTRKGVIRGCS